MTVFARNTNVLETIGYLTKIDANVSAKNKGVHITNTGMIKTVGANVINKIVLITITIMKYL